MELRLNGHLNVAHATELLSALKEAQAAGLPLAIRSPDLQSMDTSILQLLCAFGEAYEHATLEDAAPAWEASFQRAALKQAFQTQ